MTTPPINTFADARRLYDAILARQAGGQVQSVSAKGRSVSYANAGDANEMIKLYRQLRALCTAEQQAQLPELRHGEAFERRGAPAVFFGSSTV